MPQRLKTGEHRAGVKQSRKMIREGRASACFLAEDADPRVTEPIEALCRETGTEVVHVANMRAIGEACGINVGSAVAVLLK